MSMSMRERLARAALRAASKHVGGPEIRWEEQDPETHVAYLAEIDAVLTELETPTEGMVERGAMRLLRAQGYDTDKLHQYEHGPDKRETEAEFVVSFTAAIRAAKEGK